MQLFRTPRTGLTLMALVVVSTGVVLFALLRGIA